MRAPRLVLILMSMLLPAASGCSLCACRHPHSNVCDELNERSCTSWIGYCPYLDLNCIGRQRWFQPSSKLADDSRQRSL